MHCNIFKWIFQLVGTKSKKRIKKQDIILLVMQLATGSMHTQIEFDLALGIKFIAANQNNFHQNQNHLSNFYLSLSFLIFF